MKKVKRAVRKKRTKNAKNVQQSATKNYSTTMLSEFFGSIAFSVSNILLKLRPILLTYYFENV